MIGTSKGPAGYEYGVDYQFDDIFPDASPFAGVKAVYSPIEHRYLCFAKGHASGAAVKAAKTPWAICIGASDATAPEDQQRVLNLVKLTTSQQKTSRLATTTQEREKYDRWPDAIALVDVFKFTYPPHVISDLRMQTHPLKDAQTQLCDLDAGRLPIVAALRGHRIRLADLPSLPQEVTLDRFIPDYVGVEEGRAIMQDIIRYERNSEMAKLVKGINRDANGGACVCEGCGFRETNPSLFDSHHKVPLHFKVQTTTPALMAVLCPTCHRVVHLLAKMPYLPLSILKLRDWHSARTRPVGEVSRAQLNDD